MSNLNSYLKQARSQHVYTESEDDSQVYSIYIDLDEYLPRGADIDEKRTLASEFEEHGLTWDESSDLMFGTKAAWKSFYDEEKKSHDAHIAWMKQHHQSEEYKNKKAAHDANLKSKGLDWMIKNSSEILAESEKFDLGNSFEDFFSDAKVYNA